MNDHPWPSLTTTTTSTSSPPRISTLPSRATFYQSQRRQESDSMKDHLSSTTITASSSTSTSSASATPQSKQHTAMRPVRGEFDLESVKNRTLSVSTATVSYTTASTITSAIPTYPTYQETTTGHKSDSDMEYHRKLLVPTTTTSSTTALTPNFPSRRATYQTRSSPESDVVNGQMLPAITTTIITTTSSSLTTSNNTSRVTTEQIQETDSELENDRKFLVPTIETTSTLSQTTTATISSYTRGNPSSHESVSDLVNDRTSDSTTRTISTTPRTATLPSHSHSLEPPNVQEAMDAETLPNTTTTTLSTTSSSSTAAPTTQSMQTSTEVSEVQCENKY